MSAAATLSARLLTLTNRALNAALNAKGERTKDQTRVYLMSVGMAFNAAIEIVYLAKSSGEFSAAELKSLDDAVHSGGGRALLSMRAETLTEMRGHADRLVDCGQLAVRAATALDLPRYEAEVAERDATQYTDAHGRWSTTPPPAENTITFTRKATYPKR